MKSLRPGQVGGPASEQARQVDRPPTANLPALQFVEHLFPLPADTQSGGLSFCLSPPTVDAFARRTPTLGRWIGSQRIAASPSIILTETAAVQSACRPIRRARLRPFSLSHGKKHEVA